jgi:hypothetical protein
VLDLVVKLASGRYSMCVKSYYKCSNHKLLLG